MSIGANLKEIRKARGMTLEALGKAVGISQPMLTQIERGTKPISLGLATEVCDVLGCKLEDLLKGV